jgi:hypothetical protein
MTPSRRALVGLSAGAVALGAAPAAIPAPPPRSGAPRAAVTDLGARGDGETDDTAAFLAAAAAAAETIIPAGRYVLSRDIVFTAPVQVDHQALLRLASGVTVAFDGGMTAGAWRIFDLAPGARVTFSPRFTTVGHPEWWGAVSDAPDVDCQGAIQACLRACNRTLLQGADYYIGSTLKILDHGHSLEGVVPSQNGNPGASRLMLTRGDADGVQVGYDASPGGPERWLEHAAVRDLTVLRAAPLANPRQGFARAPSGVRLQWAVTCAIERVVTIDHSHGFYITGSVHCYLRYCQAFRFVDGLDKANDFFNGYFMDNSAVTPFVSGNASLYIQNCGAFSRTHLTFTESNGLKSHAGFADTFIDGFETAQLGHGLNMNGGGPAKTDPGTEDLIIERCVIDSASKVGIEINGGTRLTAVQIHDTYVSPSGGGVAIRVRGSRGAVGVTGCQIIAPPDNTATGIEVSDASGVSSMNNIITDIHNPIVVRDAASCRFIDTINNVLRKTALAAIQIDGLRRGYLAPILIGADKANPVGVLISEAGAAAVEINATGIDPGCIAGGRRNAILAGGRPVTRPGPFGGGNLASGILG